MCPPPRSVRNAISRGETFFGDSFYFSCREGFKIEGKAVLKCREDGTWDGNEPRCTGKIVVIALILPHIFYFIRKNRNDAKEINVSCMYVSTGLSTVGTCAVNTLHGRLL